MKTATESSGKVKRYGLPDGNVDMAVSSIYVVPTSIQCGWIGTRIAVFTIVRTTHQCWKNLSAGYEVNWNIFVPLRMVKFNLILKVARKPVSSEMF